MGVGFGIHCNSCVWIGCSGDLSAFPFRQFRGDGRNNETEKHCH